MGWNYLSIPKLRRLHHWINWMDKLFRLTLYIGCDYLSILGFNLNHVSKRVLSFNVFSDNEHCLTPRNKQFKNSHKNIERHTAHTIVSWLNLNSPPPSAAYMSQWTGSSLVQVMACRLFGAKPLPELMLAYCLLDTWGHISVKFEFEFYHFHSRKCIWKGRLPKRQPFCPRGD